MVYFSVYVYRFCPLTLGGNASVYETLGAAGFFPIRLHFRPRGADPLNNLVNPNVLYTLLTAAFFLIAWK